MRSNYFLGIIDILVVLLAICLMSTSGCSPGTVGVLQNITSTSTVISQTLEPSLVPQIIPLNTQSPPDYIDGVWPAPGETVSLNTYNHSLDTVNRAGGVSVTVWANEIGLMDYYPSLIEYMMRLRIDGQRVPQDTLQTGWGLGSAGPLYLNWSTKLSAGEHEAIFQIVRGKNILEYKWYFTLTEE